MLGVLKAMGAQLEFAHNIATGAARIVDLDCFADSLVVVTDNTIRLAALRVLHLACCDDDSMRLCPRWHDAMTTLALEQKIEPLMEPAEWLMVGRG